jgi:hypothetical protein
MYSYQQTFRPGWGYRIAQGPAAPPAAPVAALTPGQRTGAIVLGSAETAFGFAAAWVGVRAGMKDKGIFSILGWAVAAGGTLFGLVNLAGTVGVAKS